MTVAAQTSHSLAADFVELTKPGIVGMTVVMALCGMFVAGAVPDLIAVGASLSAIALGAAASSVLNQWYEREADRYMTRTRRRPLPAGRMNPNVALIFGVVLGALSLTMSWVFVNPLTAVLGAASMIGYVAVYTPLKSRTPHALLVGSLPGAAPALLGFTAATASVSVSALLLFGVLLIWQIPHFLAIALLRKDEYAAAGFKVLPVVRGETVTRRSMTLWTVLLLPVSLALVATGGASWIYGLVAAGCGGAFLVSVLRSPGAVTRPWARKVFIVSLFYLPILTLGLMVDGWLA